MKNPPELFKKPFVKAKKAFKPAPDNLPPVLFRAVNGLLPDKHEPRFLARGGEHLVFDFEDPKHRGIVYKVNYQESMPAIRAKMSGDPERLKKEVAGLKEKIAQRREITAQIRRYFGYNAVPAQQYQLREVPVSREIIHQLRPNLASEVKDIESAPALVLAQRKKESLTDPAAQRISLTSYYPEASGRFYRTQDIMARVDYDAAHDILAGKGRSDLSSEAQREAVLRAYPALWPLMQEAKYDPALFEKLRDTAGEMAHFIQDTGIPLELAGKDNVVLVKDKKGWELLMPDALPLGDYSVIDLEIAIERLKRGEELTPRLRGVALNVLNSVRVANALALLTDAPERVRVPELEKIPAKTWRDEFKLIFEQ